MQLLDDPSIFDSQSGKVFFHSRYSSLYADGKVTREDRYELPESIFSKYSLSYKFASYQVADEHYFAARRNQDFYSVEYIVSGRLMLRYGKYFFAAEPGDCVLFHPHHDTSLLYQPGEPLVFYGFVFTGEQLPALIRSLSLENTWCVTLKNPERQEKFCRQLMEYIRKGRSEENMLRVSGMVFEFYQRLALSKKALNSDDFADRVRQYLIKHFNEEIKAESLASFFRVCLTTMNSRFFAKYNQTPFQFLKTLRIEHAARLLIETDLSIKEIAGSSGFPSPPHFCTEFLKFFGKTPGDYRRVYDRK